MASEAQTLLRQLAHLPLSESLRKALVVAQSSGKSDFARWCQLELEGYFASSPSIAVDTAVPAYRTVAGWYTDSNGRRVELPSGQDLNVIRLRSGIEELERLPKRKGSVAFHDAPLCEWIQQKFQIEVFWYRFSAVQLAAIYSAVRVELWNKLAGIDPAGVAELPLTARNEILEPLSMTEWFAGNPRAFWRRRSKGTSKA